MPEARLLSVAGGVAVGVGRFADDEQARARLEEIRAMEIEGVRPYGAAVLAPLTQERVAVDEADLAGVAERLGDRAVYTLEIAAFRRPNGEMPPAAELARYRAQAERQARELRRQGEQAFYHHSIRGSSVTVGVFGHQDVVLEVVVRQGRQTTEMELSPRVREALKRYPLKLVNGQPFAQKVETLNGGLVMKDLESHLVKIPR